MYVYARKLHHFILCISYAVGNLQRERSSSKRDAITAGTQHPIVYPYLTQSRLRTGANLSVLAQNFSFQSVRSFITILEIFVKFLKLCVEKFKLYFLVLSVPPPPPPPAPVIGTPKMFQIFIFQRVLHNNFRMYRFFIVMYCTRRRKVLFNIFLFHITFTGKVFSFSFQKIVIHLD